MTQSTSVQICTKNKNWFAACIQSHSVNNNYHIYRYLRQTYSDHTTHNYQIKYTMPKTHAI